MPYVIYVRYLAKQVAELFRKMMLRITSASRERGIITYCATRIAEVCLDSLQSEKEVKLINQTIGYMILFGFVLS